MFCKICHISVNFFNFRVLSVHRVLCLIERKRASPCGVRGGLGRLVGGPTGP